MSWHDIRIYYYDDPGPLILHAIRPLFDRLAGQVSTLYYTRHWLRGPHIRVSLLADADTIAEVVRPAVDETAGRFLDQRPSRLRLDPAQHLRAHRRLAELEHENGPLYPWHADNSVHYTPHDRRLPVLGSEAAADLLASFHADATDLAFDMTARVAGGGQLAGLAFDLMIATAHTMSGDGIVGGFGSFRSHSEGALHMYAEVQGMRRAWDEHLRRHLPSLVDRVSAVVSTLDGERASVPFVQRWQAILDATRRRALRLLTEGTLTAASLFHLDDGEDAQRYIAEASPFHREILTDPDWPRIRSSERFTLYRLALNYTYLYLTRIGLRPFDRYLLCHLAAGAAEARYGISATAAYERSWKPTPVAAPVR
jgi:hypothetical protein